MTHSALLFSLLLKGEGENGGFPWWLALLILAIVIIVVIWALTRNASFTETPHVEHAHAEESHAAPEMPIRMEAAPAVAAVHAGEDNLELIEGIGPKIASVFKAAGIHTFAQLAAADVQALRDILLKAELRLGDPTTWPEQARLAAAGEMEALQKLQDSLKAGRKA